MVLVAPHFIILIFFKYINLNAFLVTYTLKGLTIGLKIFLKHFKGGLKAI
ncbi:hypothetical protein GZH47_28995 [Paenibacillus rhizovicinus]|uniref:Uncharacterized protein n=1 Tax=Paenibacillus rhizovicinus TaxID=2704463 RepID=A0A6C0P7Q4_9BACL|nr:hypothetical protein [Paenibacillus rhizovicinus]QHW34436.1 hypothetical protein GZH47_28995 [Paenibacillus rhizovicinus]